MLYRGYGAVIATDVPLMGFLSISETAPANIRFWLASEPEWASRALDLPRRIDHTNTLTESSGTVLRGVFILGDGILGDGEFLHIRYSDDTEFVVSADGARIFGRWRSPLTLEDTLFYALGPILALALRRQGRVCLHASAVDWQGQAVLFVGPAGAGKSTTAAAMVRHGAALISDDISTLCEQNGTFAVYSGQGLVRLWPESADLLFGPQSNLPLLTPNWEKRYFVTGRPAPEKTSETVPIVRIYSLGSCGAMPPPENLQTPESPREALMTLLGNTHGARFLDQAARRLEFQFLGRLVQAVTTTILGEQRRQVPISELVQMVKDDLARPARRFPSSME
jgi:hypothetical protein